MRRLIGGLVAVLLVSVALSNAEADYVFTSDAFFSSGPQTWGAGEWTIEQAPLGSGVTLSEPSNLADGFTVRDFVLRYVDAPGTGGIGVNWSVLRNFAAEAGQFTNTIRLGFTVELAVTQGSGAWVQWEANTLHPDIGLSSQALVYSSGAQPLTPSNPTLNVLMEASASFYNPMSSGMDDLTQSFGIYLHPTQPGQEFLIHISPDVGVTSTTREESDGNTAVPAPSSLVCLMGVGVMVVGMEWWKKRRRRP